MNSRFPFSQEDNNNESKEDESHYSTKEESTYNSSLYNNEQFYGTFSPLEKNQKYNYYYQPKGNFLFFDRQNRTNIYNLINNDKYDNYVNNPLINCNYNQTNRDISNNSIYLNNTQNKNQNKSVNKKNKKSN